MLTKSSRDSAAFANTSYSICEHMVRTDSHLPQLSFFEPRFKPLPAAFLSFSGPCMLSTEEKMRVGRKRSHSFSHRTNTHDIEEAQHLAVIAVSAMET